MRYLILSDIHANFDALTAVLENIKDKPIDKYIILGDTVDYGAQPNQTIDVLKMLLPQEAVRGDHEKWHTGELEDEFLDPAVLLCCRWTRKNLSGDSLRYIKSLPSGPRTIDNLFEIVHGAFFDEDAYILDADSLIMSFDKLITRIGFFGHTHIPVVFCKKANGQIDAIGFRKEEETVKFIEDERYLINPGSVGQPRDSNPRASFAIYDEQAKTISMCRVPYDSERAARKILDAGLPEFFASRLIVGY